MSFFSRNPDLKVSPSQIPLVLRIFTVTIGQIATWFIAVLDPTSLLFLAIVPTLTIRWLMQRRWIAAVTYIGLLPTSFFAATAVVDYIRGDGTLRGMGLPGTTYHNLDPEFRCDRSTGGCIVRGSEWIRHSPYNLTLTALIKTFGYMPGSYDGPYPTEDEAKAATAHGEPVDWKELRTDRVSIGDAEIELDSGVGEGLTREYKLRAEEEKYYRPDGRRPIPPVLGAVWQQRCLILSIPTRWDYFEDQEESGMLVLIDRNCGRPFAYFEFGDYSHHFPPVEWHKPE